MIGEGDVQTENIYERISISNDIYKKVLGIIEIIMGNFVGEEFQCPYCKKTFTIQKRQLEIERNAYRNEIVENIILSHLCCIILQNSEPQEIVSEEIFLLYSQTRAIKNPKKRKRLLFFFNISV